MRGWRPAGSMLHGAPRGDDLSGDRSPQLCPGEMAMFSTFIAWQLIQWGEPYWLAFIASVDPVILGGVAIERVLFKPIHNAPILSNIVAFIALFSILNSMAASSGTSTSRASDAFGNKPVARRGADLQPPGRHIGVTLGMLALLYLSSAAPGWDWRCAPPPPTRNRPVLVASGSLDDRARWAWRPRSAPSPAC